MAKVILRIVLGLIALVVLFIVGLVLYVQAAWDNPAPNRVPSLTASSDPGMIARGEYLYKYGHGCWGCHSPEPDPDLPPSGGRVFDLMETGPGFGYFYTPNITPDSGTGIGSWSDGEIVRAIREGVGKNGRKLFPIMPVASFNGLSDHDVLALVAYLKSLPPVAKAVRKNELSFVTKALFAFGAVAPEPEITGPIPTPEKGVTPEWGRYVTMHAGLCYDCHTPRNLQDGSFYNDSLFAGSSFPFGGEAEGEPVEVFPPNLTPDTANGIGAWTEAEFLAAMRNGVRPDGKVLSPHMPYAAYAFWDDVDAKAAYAFLMTLPPINRPDLSHVIYPSLRNAKGIDRGKELFALSCNACHGVEGSGTGFTNVKLAEVADSMTDEEILEFVREGNLGLRMPPFGKTYSNEELSDIIAYIRTWKTEEPAAK